MKQKREREEPCDICGHYHDYLNGEPCTICGHRILPNGTTPHLPSSLPTEIIPGFLFLGSYDNASRPEILRTLGIDNILNTVPSCPNLYKNSFNYHTVSTSPPPFEECFAIIESIRSKRSTISNNTNNTLSPQEGGGGGGKVLVHCMTGNSKSPSIVIYYLMKTTGMSLQSTYDEVKKLRPSIKLTTEDEERLKEAEAHIASVGARAAGGPFHWPQH